MSNRAHTSGPVLFALACAALGCSSTPEVAQVRIEATPPAPSASPRFSLRDFEATVLASDKPTEFALDGEIAEWGSLVPPPAVGAKEKALPPRTVSASHLALALDSNGVTIAGDLALAAAEGLWVGIALDNPTMPRLGDPSNALDVFALGMCSGDKFKEEPCLGWMKAYRELTPGYLARFRRLYRIDRSGVRFVSEGGKLAHVEGAKVVFKTGNDRIAMEASFPAKALPRTVQAPLSQLFAFEETFKIGKCFGSRKSYDSLFDAGGVKVADVHDRFFTVRTLDAL